MCNSVKIYHLCYEYDTTIHKHIIIQLNSF